MNGWKRLVKMSLRLIVVMVAVLHVTASILSKKSEDHKKELLKSHQVLCLLGTSERP